MTRSRQRALGATLAVAFAVFAAPVHATDLNGSWATDVAVCNKIFVTKGGVVSFQQDSDQYGGGFIIEGNKVRGQMGDCTIKSRKEDGQSVHMLAACSSGIMLSNVQLSIKMTGPDTMLRFFPGMVDDLSIAYARCP